MNKTRLLIAAIVTMVSATAFAAAPAEPQGTLKCYGTVSTIYVDDDATRGADYSMSQVVFADDNKVYIKGIEGADPQDQCFIEGTLEGDKIKVQLPQIYRQNDDNRYSYLTLYEKESYYGNEDGEYIEADDDDNYIVYAIDEEGNLNLDLNPEEYTGKPSCILACVDSRYGDIYDITCILYQSLIYLPGLTDITPNTIPSGVDMKKYFMVTCDFDRDDVYIGFDGNKVYFNFTEATYHIESTVVGEVVGDKIVIRAPQIVSADRFADLILYDEEEDSEIYEMIFECDADRQIITPADDRDILLQFGRLDSDVVEWEPGGYYNGIGSFLNPEFYFPDSDICNANPRDPHVIDFLKKVDGNFTGRIKWDVPLMNVNYIPLDNEKMYVNFYKDGELVAFEDLEGNYVSDIPEGYCNKTPEWFIVYLRSYFSLDFNYADYSTFGLQIFYNGSDGVTYASNLVTYDTATGEQTTGVKSTVAAKTIVSAEFYDLQGRRIANPAAGGIYIMRCTYSDGSVTTAKIAR